MFAPKLLHWCRRKLSRCCWLVFLDSPDTSIWKEARGRQCISVDCTTMFPRVAKRNWQLISNIRLNCFKEKTTKVPEQVNSQTPGHPTTPFVFCATMRALQFWRLAVIRLKHQFGFHLFRHLRCIGNQHECRVLFSSAVLTNCEVPWQCELVESSMQLWDNISQTPRRKTCSSLRDQNLVGDLEKRNDLCEAAVV